MHRKSRSVVGIVVSCSASRSLKAISRAAKSSMEAKIIFGPGGSKDRVGVQRDRGKNCGMCVCHRCHWKGQIPFASIDPLYYSNSKGPLEKCECGGRLFWARLSQAQANLLAP